METGQKGRLIVETTTTTTTTMTTTTFRHGTEMHQEIRNQERTFVSISPRNVFFPFEVLLYRYSFLELVL